MIRAMAVVWLGLALALVSQSTAFGAVISGRVADETGASPAFTFVSALTASDMSPIDTDQTDDGRYSVIVPDGVDTLLFAIPFSGREVGGYQVHEYTAGLKLVRSPNGIIVRDIDVLRCLQVILEGRHQDGSLMLADDLPAGSFAVDGDGEATTDLLLAVDQGSASTSVPTLCVPLGEERRLYIRRELEGAGLLDLPLDREGRPFEAQSQGTEVLDLNRATATSQLARLNDLMTALADGGHPIPDEYLQRWAGLQNAAVLASGLTGGAAAQAWDAVAAGAVVTLEDLVLWKADRDTQICRRGDLVISVESRDGWLVEGAHIAYEQISHDFLFGIFEPLDFAGAAAYQRLRQAGLNTVTAGFYWVDIEPVEGEVRWDYIDHDIGVRDLAAAGWRVKGHPLTWMMDLAMPDFLSGLDADELTQISVEHVIEIVDRYRDDVHIWDVNNEASGYGASGDLTREEMDAFLVAAFNAARVTDPIATLILNNHFDRFGRDRMQERLEGREETFTLSVRAFVERALGAGVDLDVVGQQMYNGGAVTLFAQWGLGPVIGVPTYDLGFLADTLEELAGLGKPIHITEQSVGSSWTQEWRDAGAGYWRRPWDEQTQADFTEAFYRLCFGTSAVEAVTWWNAVDSDSFIVGGGLLHDDGTPKLALLRLEALIDGWTSSGEVITDDVGRAHLNGFAGEYELKVEVAGTAQVFSVHVSEQSVSMVTLVLDSPPAPRQPAGRAAP